MASLKPSPSSSSMRQTTLVSAASQRNESMQASRKRPAAAVIEILDSDDETPSPAQLRRVNEEENNNNNDNNDTTTTTTTTNELQVPIETIGPVPYSRFLEMWEQVEEDDGWGTADFEATNAFNKANKKMSKSDVDGNTQKMAQYGRLSFKATRVIFEKIAKLQWYHVFLDVGHGVGNTVLQASCCVGCEARGIELVGIRHETAERYQNKMNEVNDLLNIKRDEKHYLVGPIRMRHGSLHAPEHRDFLTVGGPTLGRPVDVALCNNFGDVFGHRCVDKPELITMDQYLAANFALMQPDSCFITLHPLPLPPSLEESNMIRKKLGLQESDEASFYDVQEYELSGRGLLSWTNKPFSVYKYTRTAQREASFLCCNAECDKARSMQAIPATRIVGDKCLINDCDCRVPPRSSTYQCPRHQIYVNDDDDEED